MNDITENLSFNLLMWFLVLSIVAFIFIHSGTHQKCIMGHQQLIWWKNNNGDMVQTTVDICDCYTEVKEKQE